MNKLGGKRIIEQLKKKSEIIIICAALSPVFQRNKFAYTICTVHLRFIIAKAATPIHTFELNVNVRVYHWCIAPKQSNKIVRMNLLFSGEKNEWWIFHFENGRRVNDTDAWTFLCSEIASYKYKQRKVTEFTMWRKNLSIDVSLVKHHRKQQQTTTSGKPLSGTFFPFSQVGGLVCVNWIVKHNFHISYTHNLLLILINLLVRLSSTWLCSSVKSGQAANSFRIRESKRSFIRPNQVKYGVNSRQLPIQTECLCALCDYLRWQEEEEKNIQENCMCTGLCCCWAQNPISVWYIFSCDHRSCIAKRNDTQC